LWPEHASRTKAGTNDCEIGRARTSCHAYFAENQTTLEGVTENILRKLHDAVGFIAIMHPRGNVSNLSDPTEASWVRGSIWVEQEIAIAAFITQALQRSIKVRSYVHESIRREGLRDKLHLNPTIFRDESEILQDLRSILPSWHALAREVRTEPLSLKPNFQHRRVAVPGGGDDQRYMLLVGIENDCTQDVTDFRLDVEFPASFLDEGGHLARVNSTTPGMELFRVNSKQRGIEHVYPGDQISDLISLHYAVRGSVQRETPERLKEKVIATAFSGNMRPKAATKTIGELMG
jgi:hypothetical protein